MSGINFNTADPARAMGELIPHNTPAMVVLSLRPGQAGDGGWLTKTNDGACLMLDLEFTIDGGPHNKRKFWGNFIVETGPASTEGQRTAAGISMSHMRGIIESARGITPGDDSQAAFDGRTITGWGDIDGLRFPCKIGVEKGNLKNKADGPNSARYDDKNVLNIAITPDDADYVSPGAQQTRQGGSVAQAAQGAAKPAAAAGGVSKPSWAG